jgi:hypothetical protein
LVDAIVFDRLLQEERANDCQARERRGSARENRNGVDALGIAARHIHALKVDRLAAYDVVVCVAEAKVEGAEHRVRDRGVCRLERAHGAERVVVRAEGVVDVDRGVDVRVVIADVARL